MRMLDMANHIVVPILLIFATYGAMDSDLTISAGCTYILLTWQNIPVKESVLWNISVESGLYSRKLEFIDPEIPIKIGLLPPSTAFNVSVNRSLLVGGASSIAIQKRQTVRTQTIPPFGWRYDSCSGKIRFRWNLPLSIPLDEAEQLSLIYNIKDTDTNTYYKAAFLDLKNTIDDIVPGSEISFDVMLAPLNYKTNWPFTDLTIFTISREVVDASECFEEIFISTSLTAITIEWNPQSITGDLTIVCANVLDRYYFVVDGNSGSKTLRNMSPGTQFNVTIQGTRHDGQYPREHFKYARTVGTKTLDIYDTNFKVRSLCLSERIVLEWRPPNSLTDLDTICICAIFKIVMDNGTSWFHWKPLSVGRAVLEQLNPNKIDSLEIRLGPRVFANEYLWPKMQGLLSYNFGIMNETACFNEILIATSFTTITLEWNQHTFSGPVKIICESTSGLYREHTIANTGTGTLTHLPPDTDFNLTVIGMRHTRHNKSTANFRYINSVRIRTLDLHTEKLKFHSRVSLDHIVFSWNPPSNIPEHDAADLRVIFHVVLEDGRNWFQSKHLNANHAFLKHLQPNTKHFVDIRIGPWPYGNDYMWDVLRYQLFYVIITSETQMGGGISVTSSFTTVTFMWNPGEYFGTLNFHLESDISMHTSSADRRLGYKTISQLPPGKFFVIKVLGSRLIGNTGNISDVIYSSAILTKTLRIHIEKIESPNRIIFNWDNDINVPLEDSNDLLLIFKITQNDGSIRFYKQSFNASQAELDPLQTNSSYRVEVGFGPLKYATLSLWEAIASHYSYAIATRNIDHLDGLASNEEYKMAWIREDEMDTFE